MFSLFYLLLQLILV